MEESAVEYQFPLRGDALSTRSGTLGPHRMPDERPPDAIGRWRRRLSSGAPWSDRVDVFLAARAVIAVDRLRGDLRLEVLGQVLDQPRAGSIAALQRAAATRADFAPVGAALVDARRRWPGWPLRAPGFLRRRPATVRPASALGLV